MTELRPWLQHLTAHRTRLWAGALLMAATLLSAIGLLAVSGWFITATGVTALAWAAGLAASIDVYVPGGGIRFFALSRTVSRYFERLYNHDTVLRVLADLRTTLFSALSQLDAQTQSRYRAAQWLNRLTRDIDTLDNLYLRLLAPPLVALLGIVVVAALVALFLPGAGVTVFLLTLALLGLSVFVMLFWGRKLSSAQVEQTDQLRVTTVEQLQGLAELSAWQVLPEHQRRLLALEQVQSNGRFLLDCRAAWGEALVLGGIQATVVLTLLLALMGYQEDRISGPVMVMLPLAVMALYEGLATLPTAFVHWGATESAARRLNEQRALSEEASPRPAPSKPMPPLAPLVWDAVSLQRGATPVFEHLDLTLAVGEKLAVVGPSGAGKSSLGALAAGTLSPTKGMLRVGSQPLAEIDPDRWRCHMAQLTQDAHLFNDSLAVNLRIACPTATDERLWWALEQVALAETVSGFDGGLETVVGEFGRKLSGGEARRVALARIFLREPKLVILDEPLTGLDQATAAKVNEHLERFLKDRSALLLAHDPAALPRADRTLLLSSKGQLSRVR